MSKSQSPLKSNLLLQLLLATIVIAIGVAIFLFLIKSKPETEAAPVEERSWNVSALKIEPGNHSPSLQIFGQVTTQIDSQINSTISAFVEELNISEGDTVEQFTPLITLDRSDIELAYQQQLGARNAIRAEIAAEKARYRSDLNAIENEKALVNLSKRTVDRYRSLKGKNLSSQLQLEDAERSYQQQLLSLNTRQLAINDHPNRVAKLEANLLQTQAALDKALLDLERTDITAPFDGKVSEVLVSPGERVNQGTALLRMYSTDSLELRGQIPSRYLPVIREALNQQQPVYAVGKINNQTYKFELDRLASEIRSGQGGVNGFFNLVSDSKTELELGRSFALYLSLPSIAEAIVIPPQALYGTDRVYKIVDNRLMAIQINRLGDAINDEAYGILVKSDELKAGDSIITTQLPTAVSGLKVTLVEPKQ